MNTKIDLKFIELKALYIANILSAIAKNFRKNCKCKNSLGVILLQKKVEC